MAGLCFYIKPGMPQIVTILFLSQTSGQFPTHLGLVLTLQLFVKAVFVNHLFLCNILWYVATKKNPKTTAAHYTHQFTPK